MFININIIIAKAIGVIKFELQQYIPTKVVKKTKKIYGRTTTKTPAR